MNRGGAHSRARAHTHTESSMSCSPAEIGKSVTQESRKKHAEKKHMEVARSPRITTSPSQLIESRAIPCSTRSRPRTHLASLTCSRSVLASRFCFFCFLTSFFTLLVSASAASSTMRTLTWEERRQSQKKKRSPDTKTKKAAGVGEAES